MRTLIRCRASLMWFYRATSTEFLVIYENVDMIEPVIKFTILQYLSCSPSADYNKMLYNHIILGINFYDNALEKYIKRFINMNSFKHNFI